MRIRSVILQNYRNVPLAQVGLAGRRVFLEGANGQGKTNFLEAIGLVTALRSFRSPEAGAGLEPLRGLKCPRGLDDATIVRF